MKYVANSVLSLSAFDVDFFEAVEELDGFAHVTVLGEGRRLGPKFVIFILVCVVLSLFAFLKLSTSR